MAAQQQPLRIQPVETKMMSSSESLRPWEKINCEHARVRMECTSIKKEYNSSYLLCDGVNLYLKITFKNFWSQLYSFFVYDKDNYIVNAKLFS